MTEDELSVEDSMSVQGVFNVTIHTPCSVHELTDKIFVVSKGSNIVAPGEYKVTVVLNLVKVDP